MDFQEIKEIIQKDGGMIVIVEEGKPLMVVMAFDEYKRKTNARGGKPVGGEGVPEQRVHEVEPLLVASEERRQEDGELTIDDLPV